jgi:transcriptional regulator with XRE-family HTH domain
MPSMDMGRRIREAREGLGLSQHQLAELAGVSQRAVSYAERQTWVKQSTLEKYAAAVGRPLSHFLRPYGEELASGLSEAEAVQQAFAVVCRDPDFGFRSRGDEHLSSGAMKDIVRLYERYKGVSLLPPATHLSGGAISRPRKRSRGGDARSVDSGRRGGYDLSLGWVGKIPRS